MKKTIAIILALMLSLSLFACGAQNGGDGGGGIQQSNNGAESEDIGQGEVLASGNAGGETTDYSGKNYYTFFDNTFDYDANERYSVAYIVLITDVLYEAFSNAFTLWAERYNCDYQFVNCGGDTNLFMNTMNTLVANGADGLFLDPNAQDLPRVTEYAQELVGDSWMSVMTFPHDYDGNYNHPFVGFDNFQLGVQQAQFVIDYAKENYEGFDIEKAMFVGMDFTVSPQLTERVQGMKAYFLEQFPGREDKFLALDTTAQATPMAESSAYDLLSTTITMNDGVEYYLIGGNIDTWAIGAARALEQFGLDDKAAIVVCGGNALISEWDSGITSAWKGAIYTPQLIYAEPIFGAVYYMINGWCTAKDLWPDYVTDNTNGYGALLLNSVAITQENYQEFLEWVDWHSGFDWSPYENYGGTKFELLYTPE
jgi:ABC-type sugar transport system substrate-binding protein